MAEWAYETACAIIDAVINMLPVTTPPLFGVTWLKGHRPSPVVGHPGELRQSAESGAAAVAFA